MFICGSCGRSIKSYDDIKILFITINDQAHAQETCPHCKGDIRKNVVVEKPRENNNGSK